MSALLSMPRLPPLGCVQRCQCHGCLSGGGPAVQTSAMHALTLQTRAPRSIGVETAADRRRICARKFHIWGTQTRPRTIAGPSDQYESTLSTPYKTCAVPGRRALSATERSASCILQPKSDRGQRKEAGRRQLHDEISAAVASSEELDITRNRIFRCKRANFICGHLSQCSRDPSSLLQLCFASCHLGCAASLGRLLPCV